MSLRRTASFEGLPSELVLLIFEYVGHNEFRRIELLCVSKHWYAIARTVPFQDTFISGTSARLLRNIGPETIQLNQENLRHFRIDVNMIRDSGWRLTNRRIKTVPGNETGRMNKSSFEIGSILSKCENLQQVTICAVHNLNHIFPRAVQYNFWIGIHIWKFISAPPLENLTCLSLETYGFKTSEHACNIIGPRLHNLRRLWIRMDRFCPDLFLLGNGAATPATMRLERLVINLRRLNRDGALSELNAGYCFQFIKRTVELAGIIPWELKEPLSEQIEALYARSNQRCKFLRLIYYNHEAQGSKGIDLFPETVETVLSSQEEEYEGFREPENEDSAD